jgi:hypothetical protein
VLYHLVDGPLDGSNPDAREYLVSLAEHPVEWLAARALEELAHAPATNEPVLRNRLRNEERQVVLIRLLKALYEAATDRFADELVELTDQTDRPQVQFYAAVILKARHPDRLDALAEESPYLRKLRERVTVDTDEGRV